MKIRDKDKWRFLTFSIQEVNQLMYVVHVLLFVTNGYQKNYFEAKGIIFKGETLQIVPFRSIILDV